MSDGVSLRCGQIKVSALKTQLPFLVNFCILYLVVAGPAVDGVCACVYSSSLEAVCASVCIVPGAKNTQ